MIMLIMNIYCLWVIGGVVMKFCCLWFIWGEYEKSIYINFIKYLITLLI